MIAGDASNQLRAAMTRKRNIDDHEVETIRIAGRALLHDVEVTSGQPFAQQTEQVAIGGDNDYACSGSWLLCGVYVGLTLSLQQSGATNTPTPLCIPAGFDNGISRGTGCRRMSCRARLHYV